MNLLQPRSTPDTPVRLFEATGEERITKETRAAIAAPQDADPRLFPRLAWRPALFALLFDELGGLQDQAVAGVTDPIRALNIVEARPSLLPFFRERILGDPAAAEQLAEIAQMRPDDFPAGAGGSLPADPNRRLRVLATDQAVYHAAECEVLDQMGRRRLESPGWAFAWLTRNQIPANGPLDPGLVAVLKQDEEYSYLAMRILRDRLAEPEAWAALESSIVSPRWAYAALRSGLLMHDTDRCEEVLLGHPAWLVEYLDQSRADWPKVQRVFPRCRTTAGSHELIPDLDDWIEIIALVQDMRNARGAEETQAVP